MHFACRKVYFETDEVLNQILQFSPDLSGADREGLIGAFEAEQAGPSKG